MFIGYPHAVHYGVKGAQNKTRGTKAVNQLIWGDWAKVKEVDGNWVKIRSRGRDGWVRKERLQTDRILEVNFVDIGQGDGCHIQTPKDKAIIIDAGEGDNMYRFMRWRFGDFRRKFTFESFIVSHPDKDHYYGFKDLFDDKNVHVDTVYHNCIVEQKSAGKNSIGKAEKIGRRKVISGLVRTKEELKKITDSKARRASRFYPNMMKKAMDGGRVQDFIGLLAERDWSKPSYLPGYGPDDKKGVTLKLLGPVPMKKNGKPVLPYFKDDGKTKNGHSVALLLEIGNIRMLLGGDLNEPSRDYLLEHYTGLDAYPRTPGEIEALIEEGRKHFEVDLTKAWHHGSAHISPHFLQATNPLATVISSGDNEPHSHPRPETLGLIGKFSRSERPLIFSTELARSGNEHIKHPNVVHKEVRKTIEENVRIQDDPESTATQKKKAEEKVTKALHQIQRSVANYGMINIRTNGDELVVTQRLERERGKSKRWDVYQFECDERGRLRYIH